MPKENAKEVTDVIYSLENNTKSTNLAKGEVASNSSDAVNGAQLYVVDQKAINDQNTADQNAKTLLNKANVDGSNITTPGSWASKLGTGKVETGDTNLVTGGIGN